MSRPRRYGTAKLYTAIPQDTYDDLIRLAADEDVYQWEMVVRVIEYYKEHHRQRKEAA